jgi:hypothetical protein
MKKDGKIVGCEGIDEQEERRGVKRKEFCGVEISKRNLTENSLGQCLSC